MQRYVVGIVAVVCWVVVGTFADVAAAGESDEGTSEQAREVIESYLVPLTTGAKGRDGMHAKLVVRAARRSATRWLAEEDREAIQEYLAEGSPEAPAARQEATWSRQIEMVVRDELSGRFSIDIQEVTRDGDCLAVEAEVSRPEERVLSSKVQLSANHLELDTYGPSKQRVLDRIERSLRRRLNKTEIPTETFTRRFELRREEGEWRIHDDWSTRLEVEMLLDRAAESERDDEPGEALRVYKRAAESMEKSEVLSVSSDIRKKLEALEPKVEERQRQMGYRSEISVEGPRRETVGRVQRAVIYVTNTGDKPVASTKLALTIEGSKGVLKGALERGGGNDGNATVVMERAETGPIAPNHQVAVQVDPEIASEKLRERIEVRVEEVQFAKDGRDSGEKDDSDAISVGEPRIESGDGTRRVVVDLENTGDTSVAYVDLVVTFPVSGGPTFQMQERVRRAADQATTVLGTMRDQPLEPGQQMTARIESSLVPDGWKESGVEIRVDGVGLADGD